MYLFPKNPHYGHHSASPKLEEKGERKKELPPRGSLYSPPSHRGQVAITVHRQGSSQSAFVNRAEDEPIASVAEEPHLRLRDLLAFGALPGKEIFRELLLQCSNLPKSMRLEVLSQLSYIPYISSPEMSSSQSSLELRTLSQTLGIHQMRVCYPLPAVPAEVWQLYPFGLQTPLIKKAFEMGGWRFPPTAKFLLSFSSPPIGKEEEEKSWQQFCHDNGIRDGEKLWERSLSPGTFTQLLFGKNIEADRDANFHHSLLGQLSSPPWQQLFESLDIKAPPSALAVWKEGLSKLQAQTWGLSLENLKEILASSGMSSLPEDSVTKLHRMIGRTWPGALTADQLLNPELRRLLEETGIQPSMSGYASLQTLLRKLWGHEGGLFLPLFREAKIDVSGEQLSRFTREVTSHFYGRDGSTIGLDNQPLPPQLGEELLEAITTSSPSIGEIFTRHRLRVNPGILDEIASSADPRRRLFGPQYDRRYAEICFTPSYAQETVMAQWSSDSMCWTLPVPAVPQDANCAYLSLASPIFLMCD